MTTQREVTKIEPVGNGMSCDFDRCIMPIGEDNCADCSHSQSLYTEASLLSYKQRIAELELEVLRLREALKDFHSAWNAECGAAFGTSVDVAEEAGPFSPTALAELVENVERATIERCAEACDKSDRYRGDYFAGKCRALPTGKIDINELLK